MRAARCCQEALPFRPFRVGRHLLRRADGFPFRRRDYANEVAFDDDLRVQVL
jgi:hypothetical protein